MASKPVNKTNPDTVRQQFLEHSKRAVELARQLAARDKPSPKTGELWRTQNGSLVLILAEHDNREDEDYDSGSLDATIIQSANPEQSVYSMLIVDQEGHSNWSSDLHCVVRVATAFTPYFSGFGL